MLPPNNVLPRMRNEARKMITHMGLDYMKYHACVNDCILFHNENEHAQECPKCGEHRYEDGGNVTPRKVS